MGILWLFMAMAAAVAASEQETIHIQPSQVPPGFNNPLPPPITPWLADKTQQMEELEKTMSSQDAGYLIEAIEASLGIEAKTKTTELTIGDPWRDPPTQGLIFKGVATMQAGQCEKLHLTGVFVGSWQRQIAVDGLYCLKEGRPAFWETRYQDLTRPAEPSSRAVR